MSTFAVKVVPITVEPHPNADALELARVGDYRAVVGKGDFHSGDRVAYIPEGAVLPDDLIAAMCLTGRLAGKGANRVKAVRLRGALSQGLCLAARPGWVEGQDVTAELGVTKYEPPIPAALAGEVYALEPHETTRFDIENIKAFPDVFEEGEPVVFTEKVHGTFMMAVGLPAALARDTDQGHGAGGRFAVSSKGLMHKQLGLKHCPDNATNVYLRAAQQHHLDTLLPAAAEVVGEPVFVLGEVAGRGIQDLTYGQTSNDLLFRPFLMRIGSRTLDDSELESWLIQLGLTRTPVLYRGPFSKALLAEHTDGLETVSGQAQHLREGVVVTPVVERKHPELGRVVLKSVSEAYLLRKGGSEYN